MKKTQEEKIIKFHNLNVFLLIVFNIILGMAELIGIMYISSPGNETLMGGIGFIVTYGLIAIGQVIGLSIYIGNKFWIGEE